MLNYVECNVALALSLSSRVLSRPMREGEAIKSPPRRLLLSPSFAQGCTLILVRMDASATSHVLLKRIILVLAERRHMLARNIMIGAIVHVESCANHVSCSR